MFVLQLLSPAFQTPPAAPLFEGSPGRLFSTLKLLAEKMVAVLPFTVQVTVKPRLLPVPALPFKVESVPGGGPAMASNNSRAMMAASAWASAAIRAAANKVGGVFGFFMKRMGFNRCFIRSGVRNSMRK